jgi:ABC-type sugar transport system substrate-binding protein
MKEEEIQGLVEQAHAVEEMEQKRREAAKKVFEAAKAMANAIKEAEGAGLKVSVFDSSFTSSTPDLQVSCRTIKHYRDEP